MKIYILFRDVPYEFGEIYDVFSNQEESEKELANIKSKVSHPEEFSLQKWDIECPNCGK